MIAMYSELRTSNLMPEIEFVAMAWAGNGMLASRKRASRRRRSALPGKGSTHSHAKMIEAYLGDRYVAADS